MNAMELNEKLLELRKKNGLSQEDLAVELEISQSTISNYEKGLTIPDIMTLGKYATFFQIPIEDLIKNDTNIVYNYQNSGGENAFQIIKNTDDELINQYKETISTLKEQVEQCKETISLLKDEIVFLREQIKTLQKSN